MTLVGRNQMPLTNVSQSLNTSQPCWYSALLHEGKLEEHCQRWDRRYIGHICLSLAVLSLSQGLQQLHYSKHSLNHLQQLPSQIKFCSLNFPGHNVQLEDIPQHEDNCKLIGYYKNGQNYMKCTPFSWQPTIYFCFYRLLLQSTSFSIFRSNWETLAM